MTHEPLAPHPRLGAIADAHPYPLLFATVSGAHLYGFPSPDSDWDLRGCHVLPPAELLGIDTGPETLETMEDRDGLELDLVTHDAGKFFRLLLKRNGYVLEQLLSPLVVRTTPAHDALKELAPDLMTRHHAHHYRGFAHTQWRLFEGGSPRELKPLLYTYRVLLTGIHLMRAGELVADLRPLAEAAELAFVGDLIAQKREGGEHATADDEDPGFHEEQVTRLHAALDEAAAATRLPDAPPARAAVHDLLVRVRLEGPGPGGT